MSTFEEAYNALNGKQKEAVDTLEGPLLVIAGPGTGKTQLLSARVANILKKTDTPSKNILCLTFTENGAENMRERLTRFIGKSAYDVTISTYHAFGGDLIRRFPEYFTETRLQNPVDELTKRQIITEIVEAMSYTNPLKQTRHHLDDLIATLSEVKRALLSSEDLRLLAKENLLFIERVSHDTAQIFASFSRMPTIKSALPLFEQTLNALTKYAPAQPANEQFGTLAGVAIGSLQVAIVEAESIGKTTPLTVWKNDWLAKNDNNALIFGGELESKRMRALADVLEQYQAALATRGLYDFDDMIIRAVEVLENNPDLRFTLQERYLYILLDEFQDTNPAQLKIVQLLTDNPVNEGRPNVMAVGDDDQAIYAFQGAQYSNMLDFHNMYRDIKVINLTENYRSHHAILEIAQNIVEQIESRLHHYFNNTSKTLLAVNSRLPKAAAIQRCEFLSEIAQADWIAREVKKLVDAGTSPREIAILAPRHRQLEPLIPYLNSLSIPVRYEKRENILDSPIVKQLVTMSKLVLALRANDEATADSLWPEVLSYDFWNLSTSRIWQMSWHVTDQRHDGKHSSWSSELLQDGKTFRIPALLFLTLANRVDGETCETMLDYLIGTTAAETHEKDISTVTSPLREYYTGTHMREKQPELFYNALTHLTVLRARLREHEATTESALTLRDLIRFIEMYEAADERMQNTSPYNQQADAVQVMTVFKAKGLEFAHVFLPSMQDEVWGATSRSQSNRLTLPANLAPIRHVGTSDDERLRILYVAITRAKIGLCITNAAQNYSGKATKRLKYLDEQEQADNTIKDLVLPPAVQTVKQSDTEPPAIELLELDWRHRHKVDAQQTNLISLLLPRLKNYQLSPTHLTSFLDLEYGGPGRFFFTTILRFPEASSPDSQFGNAIHETLQWYQYSTTDRGSSPSVTEAIAYFIDRMKAKKIALTRETIEIERGEKALAAYLTTKSNAFKPNDKAETSFRNENVFIDEAHLAGKVDKLEIDTHNKQIVVVDYKTGKSYSRWESDPKLHRYRRQLYAYKILVEQSMTYSGYTVTAGRLEFIEPDKNNKVNVLELNFKNDELEQTKQLMLALWHHVKQLKFPDTSNYEATLSGIRKFEQDLIEQTI